MAYYLTELYTPKPAWQALNMQSRQKFLANVQQGMSALAGMGIEAISFGAVDSSWQHASKHAFFALWRFRDEVALHALIAGIEGCGWYNYFATVNAAGFGNDMAAHLIQLATY